MNIFDHAPNSAPLVIALVNPNDKEEALVNGDGTPMTVSIMNPETLDFQSEWQKISVKIQKAQKSKKAQELKDAFADYRDFVSGVIVGWKISGAEGLIEFNPEAVEEILTTLPWVVIQIIDGVKQDQDFS